MRDIASTDAYARSTPATVMDSAQDGVVLDRTVFHARGGGQPGDTGWLRWHGGQVQVTDTVRREDVVVHVVEGGSPRPGESVIAEVAWERRHVLMRTHTALHVLSAIVWRDYEAKVTGGNMEPGAARMDFELPGMPEGFREEVERTLNDELSADRPIQVRFVPREEALSDPDLIRTKVNLIPETVDPVRVVDIEGIDRQADGGTHVRSTGEVGAVRVVKLENKGKSFKRIRIELSEP